MKIHTIRTGTVAVTTAWREGVGHGAAACCIRPSTGNGRIRYRFTRSRHPVFRAFRQWVEPEQEIGPQLVKLGISPSDVRWVVMTHLHTDHAGGLHHFPSMQILVSRAEIEYAATGLGGRLRGYPNNRWAAWFDPTPLDLEPEPFGPFPQSLRLTNAGDVTLVPVLVRLARQRTSAWALR